MARMLPRLLWIGLAILHMPILVGAMASMATGESGAGPAMTLLASLSFFILKSIDVPWLRLRSRVAGIALMVVAGLIHAEVIADAADDPVTWQVPAILVTSGLIVRTVTRGQTWKPVLRSVAAVVRLDRITWATICVRSTRRPLLLAIRSSSGPRAPPAWT